MKVGEIYRIRSRNLLVGVFVGQDWNDEFPRFIGIREKFGSRFLFEEYGWDPVLLGVVPYWAVLNVNDTTLRRCLAQYDWRARRDDRLEWEMRWNADGSPK